MTRTTKLVKLLEKRSCNPENPYPFIAGWLTGLLEKVEREYKSAEVMLDEEINRVLEEME